MSRIDELTNILTQASRDYYAGTPSMDDHEYDGLEAEYFNLTGKRFAIIEDVKGIPFKHVWHGKSCRAKSLDKTKDPTLLTNKFKSFTGASSEAVLMWKLDGSTIQLYYEDGDLKEAVTRGTEGEEGIIITHNAPYIHGIPQHINTNAKYDVIRGEALMSYAEFDRIAAANPNEDYANPRNLATNTLGMKDPLEGVAKRQIDFKAFSFVMHENEDGIDLRPVTMSSRLDTMAEMGFNVVEHEIVPIDDLESAMARFEEAAADYAYPVDGEVAAYEDIIWAEKQPSPEHNPHISVGYALKWPDELVKTTLRGIKWNTTRTGKINPVAVFDPVWLEGTEVSRATLHNISFIANKDIRVGDEISVYKANKIIPKVEKSITAETRGERLELMKDYAPCSCPCCNADVRLVRNLAAVTAECTNPDCDAKAIDKLIHFASKKAMNIDGLSEAKIEFLLKEGFIQKYPYTIYEMAEDYRRWQGQIWNSDMSKDLSACEGWGPTSVKNLIEAINKSRHTTFVQFIVALGIPNFGRGQAKILKEALIEYTKRNKNVKEFYKEGSKNLFNILVYAYEHGYDFESIEGFGSVIAGSLKTWLEENVMVEYNTMKGRDFRDLYSLIHLDSEDDKINFEAVETNQPLKGMTFVITGTLNHFTNRKELSDLIESKGGKVSGSVSAKSTFLINNDTESTSGKNKKAKELGIKIISEEDFLEME